MLVDQGMDLLLGFMLVVFGDRNNRVGNLVKVRDRLVVGMIRNDERDVAGEFAALVTVEEIDEAVIVLRDQDDHSRTIGRLSEVPLHLKLFGDGGKMFGEVGGVFIGDVFIRK